MAFAKRIMVKQPDLRSFCSFFILGKTNLPEDKTDDNTHDGQDEAKFSREEFCAAGILGDLI